MLKKLSITELNRRALIESIKNDELDFAMSSWTQCIAGHCHRVMSARRDEPFGTEDKTPAEWIREAANFLGLTFDEGEELFKKVGLNRANAIRLIEDLE